MFVEVVRLFMVVLCTAAGFWIGGGTGARQAGDVAGLGGMLGCLVGYVTGGLLGRGLQRGLGVVERRVERLPATAVLAGLMGGAAGAMVGAAAAAPLVLIPDLRVSVPLGGLVVWCAAYLGYRVAVHESDELLGALGLSTRPLVRATPFAHGDGALVDTSVVMDGQLLALTRSGLLGEALLVPRFVLDELRGLADARDESRSRRAARGLEMLEALRRESPGRLFVLDDEVPEMAEVDTKLVALARRLQLRLLTNDAHLSRIAEVQGVPTVNLRRLASDLAPGIQAGQELQVALVRAGRHEGQGVGFLEDGSMVVVNDGADLVGAGELDLVATSVVPTSAGRIIFARLPVLAAAPTAVPTAAREAGSGAARPPAREARP